MAWVRQRSPSLLKGTPATSHAVLVSRQTAPSAYSPVAETDSPRQPPTIRAKLQHQIHQKPLPSAYQKAILPALP